MIFTKAAILGISGGGGRSFITRRPTEEERAVIDDGDARQKKDVNFASKDKAILIDWVLGRGGMEQGYLVRQDVPKLSEKQLGLMRRETLIEYCEALRSGAMPQVFTEEELMRQGGKPPKKKAEPFVVKMKSPVSGGA